LRAHRARVAAGIKPAGVAQRALPTKGGYRQGRAHSTMRAMNAKSLPPARHGHTLLHSAARPNPAPTRATLEGLEVQESCFGQWLAAGGERRSRPRELPTDSAPQF
jgi:hypothetical protein